MFHDSVQSLDLMRNSNLTPGEHACMVVHYSFGTETRRVAWLAEVGDEGTPTGCWHLVLTGWKLEITTRRIARAFLPRRPMSQNLAQDF
jgi:hypothetical protein